MNKIEYIGEHLLPGQIGHFLIVLAFVAALLAVFAFWKATQTDGNAESRSWLHIGRVAFVTQGVGIVTVMGIIFHIMTQKYYEYQYVQLHTNDELPFRYIFAAFWEGQEGSFLLWTFWHIVLGIILLYKAKSWEAPVLATLSAIQVILISMILGVYFGDIKIGSNPLMLLRDVTEAPIFSKSNYVSLIKGNGLNPLLQNYWMTIHPPTLFLGFASTSIPFCFAIAALWTNRHRDFLTKVMPWALFSAAILGTGILMGGAWAYEALSFGGYWAWDPVENMSLVPWLILLAGIHTNLIAKVTGHSYKSTYIYYMLTFILILYSTFLTRSGILGDTSVHAFTEMGLEWQLVIFIFVFSLLGISLFFVKNKEIPVVTKEESADSKEFWMFIGTLVLLFSAVLITFTTSIPVYNKVGKALGFAPNFSSPIDAVGHYNKYQLWIGVFMGLLSGFSQYLRFKETKFANHWKKFIQHTGIAVIVSAILTFVTSYWIQLFAWQYWILAFTGIFTIVTNTDYIYNFLRFNMKAAGSAFSHIGFGLMIVGIMASGLNKMFISTNRFAQEGLIEGFTEDDYKKNIVLLKGKPMLMSGYEVTYEKDSIWGHNREFKVNYKKKTPTGETVEEFNLFPNILYDKEFKKIAASNPSTKHYVEKDIFTHVSSLPKAELDMDYAKQIEDSLKYVFKEILLGETYKTNKYSVTIDSILRNPTNKDYKPEVNDLVVGVMATVEDSAKTLKERVTTMLMLRGADLYTFPATVTDLKLKIKLDEKMFERTFTPESSLNYKEYIFSQGQAQKVGDAEIIFENFDKNPQNVNYKKEEKDVAVGAMLSVRKSNQTYRAEPIYIIRGNEPYNLKSEIGELGLHFRFAGIDPKSQTVTLAIAQSAPKNPKIPLQIADNHDSSEFIVMEAILFPGINLFWLGTVLMMSGLALSMVRRIKPTL